MTKLIQSCLVSCLVLSLVLVNVSGLFWRQSNCNNDRQVILNTGFAELIFLFIFFTLQCPDIKRSTCRNCFPGFIGIPSVTQRFPGRCISADNGFLCLLLGGGSRCSIRVCRECYQETDCVVYNHDVRF